MFEMTAGSAADAATNNLAGMYAWGLSVIRAFQGAGNPVLTALARFFTLLGDPIAYILILPVIFWCVDEKRGFRIGLTVFLSNGINVALKETLRVPRPFFTDPSVKLVGAEGFSTPSGHSQSSATFWPLFFGTSSMRAPFLKIALSAVLPLCIGLSRIYLGVHYPTDVFFGWALGALIAACALLLPDAAPVKKLLASFAKSAAGAGKSLRSFKLAASALVSLALNHFSGTDSSMAGAFFGFSAGYILLTESSAAPFSAAAGTLVKKGLRLALGLAVLGILYLGLKMAFPGEESAYYALFRFMRYGIVGFWASWGAPKLFVRTGLR